MHLEKNVSFKCLIRRFKMTYILININYNCISSKDFRVM